MIPAAPPSVDPWPKLKRVATLGRGILLGVLLTLAMRYEELRKRKALSIDVGGTTIVESGAMTAERPEPIEKKRGLVMLML